MSLYKVVKWNENLDLTEFYQQAEKRGFINNSSQKMLVDSIAKEKEWSVWLLYYKNRPVGSVAAHSFDEIMGPNSYRIAVRTCVFTDRLEGTYGNALRTISVITKHQNPTAQFLIPTCIDWCPTGANLYITSNENSVGTQRRVHNIFGPTLERQGIMKRIKDIHYRGTDQTVWRFNPSIFYQQLDLHGRWV